MRGASCGDINDVPIWEEPQEASETDSEHEESTSESDSHTHRTSRESRKSTAVPKDEIPEWLRVLAIGPVESKYIFKAEAQRDHEFPILMVRNRRMAEYFGEQWWSSAKQNETVKVRR